MNYFRQKLIRRRMWRAMTYSSSAGGRRCSRHDFLQCPTCLRALDRLIHAAAVQSAR